MKGLKERFHSIEMGRVSFEVLTSQRFPMGVARCTARSDSEDAGSRQRGPHSSRLLLTLQTLRQLVAAGGPVSCGSLS